MTPIYGHRGARGERPENSLAGFRHAIAAGAAGIETDIALTTDLIPVLRHDPELPDGQRIRDLPASALGGVVSLAEALRALPDADWLLEIKTYPPQPARSHPPRMMVEAVLGVLAKTGVSAARLHVLAFDWSVLEQVAVQAPKLRRICLTAPPQERERALWWGSDYAGLSAAEAAFRTGAVAWAPHHADLTAPAIAAAQALGLGVIPWTVNEPADFARLAPLADGLITDFPARVRAGGMDAAV